MPIRREIVPLRIHGRDQRLLLRTNPPLDLLFTSDCVANVAELLKVDQPIAVVLLREAGDRVLLVLPDAALERIRDARVKDRLVLVRQAVDEERVVAHLSLSS